MEDRRGGAASWARWLGLVMVVGVFLAGAASFLPEQGLWVDEATQITGLRLGPVGVTRWLTGGEPSDTGQFRDRMPPLSYWLGWAWTRAFGFHEAALRWFGVACVGAASALVYEAARRSFGTASAWVAGLLFALNPALVVLSVEIRSYPLFALWSALAFYALARLSATPPDDRPATYAILSAALAGAILTHFFGAVLAGAMLGTLLLLAVRGTGRFRPVLAVAGVVALASAAIVPFIVASTALYTRGIGKDASVGARLDGVKNMLFGLVKHVTLQVDRPVTAVALTAAAVLLAIALGAARRARRPGVAVALTLGIGVLMVTAAKLVLSKFDATSSNYNVWMRPGLCILLAAGVASTARTARRAAAVASVLLIAAQADGVYQLAAHGHYFTHGPHRAVLAAIGTRDPRALAVVHDDPSHRYVFVSCPLRCEFGAALDQFKPVPSPVGAPLVCADRAWSGVRPVTDLPYPALVVVRTEATNPPNVAAQVRDGDRPLAPGTLSRALRASGDWRLVSETVAVSAISGRIDVFERSRPPR